LYSQRSAKEDEFAIGEDDKALLALAKALTREEAEAAAAAAEGKGKGRKSKANTVDLEAAVELEAVKLKAVKLKAVVELEPAVTRRP